MIKKVLQISLLSLLMACSTVPITGRRQLDLVPDSQILTMSFDQYNQFLNENRLSGNAQATTMVKRVGQRIQQAVEQYMRQNNMSEQLNGYQWEFNLVQSNEVNAWAMPGGKVVVYEGLLDVTQDEAGLAVVMGHEIAHAIAKHGNERMSQGLVQQFGGVALSVALSNKPQATQDLFLTSYGVGSQLGMLKYGRTQESEADRLGLIFMAMAGYDPQKALEFWQRMAASKDGQGAPPQILSSHPSDATRIRDLQKHMDEALRYNKPR